mgnify:CR=1 FL=1
MTNYLKSFTMAGAVVAGIQYLANEVDPELAGVLSGIPISIPSMLLIKKAKDSKEFIWDASLMITVLTIITYITWYLYIKQGVTKEKSVAFSMGLWFVFAMLYYFVIVKKKK